MRVRKNISGRNNACRKNAGQKNEQGVIITLVAVFVLFVLGAMAALSIDVVTLYTARSEAQLAADSAALAAARVLANSGATSDTTLMASAQTLAQGVAVQVGEQNQVGGSSLIGKVNCCVFAGTDTNPTVKVSVVNVILPTFFARIWGTKSVTVGASATAEAYNPSPGPGAPVGSTTTPVAPMCVKPWLLPNMDPSNGGAQIFDPVSGIPNPLSKLLGWSWNTPSTGASLTLACAGGNCTPPLPGPGAWKYYPGDTNTTFAPPATALPTCSQIPTLTLYQASVVGCIQTPISCNSTANIDASSYPNRNTETADAVNCLTHCTGDQGDTVTTKAPPSAPFEFVAGADNPEAVANPALAGQSVMVSDSLVTVPVFDVITFNPNSASVQIIGFVQLFLNPDGFQAPDSGPFDGNVRSTVINLAGCGTSATAQPILGNGASPVAVRLISP